MDVAEGIITDPDSNGKVRLRVDTWASGNDMLCCAVYCLTAVYRVTLWREERGESVRWAQWLDK